MDLTQLLLAAQSNDQNALNAAQQQLKQLENQDFASYATALVTEMGTEGKPQEARQLAGLLIKNSLVARDAARRHELTERWMKLDLAVRARIKLMLVHILASPVKDVRSTASLAVASIAAIEIPANVWPDLISTLTKNVQENNPHLRQASFECLGYICEENGQYLQGESNHILNAIAAGMNENEKNNDIKYAATTALANSIDFVEQNMGNASERNFIMTMVFGAATSEDPRVRVASLQCLVQIASTYYSLIEPYMQNIFSLTSQSMMKEVEEVQLQSIEFWSTISDQEILLKEEEQEAQYSDGISAVNSIKQTNKNYIVAALPTLVPQLLQLLTQQSEDVDDDTWNPAMASAACLSLCAQAAGDPIVPLVLSFVTLHISSPDWRKKEAATIAFGCILDGPSVTHIKDLVSQALPVILTNMQDSNDLVKDTASWTLGRICNLVPETTQPMLDNVVQAFLIGLKDVPSVAGNVCWAIHNLSQACPNDSDDENITNILSKYFQFLMENLLVCAERPDTDKHNLLSSVYEAINSLINSAAKDVYPLIQLLLTPLLKKLESTLKSSAMSQSEKEKMNEAQALLCGALQTMIQKLDMQFIQSHADSLMIAFMHVLESKNATVHEEALMAIGALANRLGESFERFVEVLQPYLRRGLENEREYKVCTVAVGLVGDIARALDKRFQSISDKIMEILLTHLQSVTIERSVKPHIISCLGDIALAVGGSFQRYLQYVHRILIPASALSFEGPANYDDLDYLDSLRESILEAWTAILQGLAADNAQDAFLQPVMVDNRPVADPLENVLKFFRKLATEESNVPEMVLRNACSLIGDLCNIFGAKIQNRLREPQYEQSVANLIQLAVGSVQQEDSYDRATKEAGQWAAAEYTKLR